MRRISFVLLLTLLVSLLSAFDSAAAQGPKLKGEMKARRIVVNDRNEEVAVKADKVYPNDTIEYSLKYTNVGDQTADGVNLMGLIPEGTVYVESSATRNDRFEPLFSIDGGKSFHREPVEYFVVDSSGKQIRKTATPDMYTNIRWLVRSSLGVGEDVVVNYRVRVE